VSCDSRVQVQGKDLIETVVVVHANSIGPGLYARCSGRMPTFTRIFRNALPTSCPGTRNRVHSAVDGFLFSSLSRTAKASRDLERQALEKQRTAA
jgi:hypothetical protein